MSKLKKVLKKKKYIRVKLKRMKTNHLELSAKINGIKGRFILDTGASNSCIGLDLAERFKMTSEESEIKSAGAGGIDMDTHISENNSLKIGKWKTKKLKLVLFDLQHINMALEQRNETEVHGIIGADVLEVGEAFIDYKNKFLYLKKPKKKSYKKFKMPF